ncbi:hypothetical protein HY440_02605 [Candidatus Microgenomates bacterium]|nr:hypothetical protein [Candidatus Microgenomates bacterium]
MSEAHEGTATSEIPRGPWQTLILFQRHSAYDSRRVAHFSQVAPEEKIFGQLTPEGRAAADARAFARVESILATTPEKVDFLVVNSPSHWLGLPELGQRARETASRVAYSILAGLAQRNLSYDHLLNLSGRFKGEETRPDLRIEETRVFDVLPFANLLREKSGGLGPDFWKNFYDDTYREEREKLGAEGPDDIADRAGAFLKVTLRFARRYHHDKPDRRLVIWLVSHSEVLESYLQKRLKLPLEKAKMDYNDAFSLVVDATNHVQAIAGDQTIEVS